MNVGCWYPCIVCLLVHRKPTPAHQGRKDEETWLTKNQQSILTMTLKNKYAFNAESPVFDEVGDAGRRELKG